MDTIIWTMKAFLSPTKCQNPSQAQVIISNVYWYPNILSTELSLVLRMHFQPPATAACQATAAPNLLLPQRHEVEEVGTESPLALLPLQRPTPGLCGYGSRRRNPRRLRVRAVDEPLWNNRWVIWFVKAASPITFDFWGHASPFHVYLPCLKQSVIKDSSWRNDL